MQKFIVFGMIKSLYDLFTALWVGGILTTAISLLPAVRKSGLKPAVFNSLNEQYQRRLRVVALVSIVGLWITGILLGRQSAAFSGFMNFATTYETLISVKHLLIIAMVGIAVVRGFILGRNTSSATLPQRKLSMGLLLINSILGVVVIFLSGISATLG